MDAPITERPAEVALLIKAARDDQRSIPARFGQPLTTILEVFASERGCAVDELIIIREGETEPLSALIIIDEHYPHRRRHHVHHSREVTVKVCYQAGVREQSFRRHATVEQILGWASRAFGVDPTMSAEIGLARHGEEEELPGGEHIGHLAGHRHEVALDLVRGPIANGSP